MQPDRRDELARIEASGGRVVFANGPRVQGILAMSRAIGNISRLENPFSDNERSCFSYANKSLQCSCEILLIST